MVVDAQAIELATQAFNALLEKVTGADSAGGVNITRGELREIADFFTTKDGVALTQGHRAFGFWPAAPEVEGKETSAFRASIEGGKDDDVLVEVQKKQDGQISFGEKDSFGSFTKTVQMDGQKEVTTSGAAFVDTDAAVRPKTFINRIAAILKPAPAPQA